MQERKITKVLLTEEEISKKVSELAKQIENDYIGEEIVIVCFLTGSMMFVSDLVRRIGNKVSVKIEALPVSVYEGAKRSDKVRVNLDLKTNLKGRHVLIVDDIIEKGDTMDYIARIFEYQNPQSLKICVLLTKSSARTKGLNIEIDYLGFAIGNEFVVGYGMDYDQQYRNLPYIGVLS